MKKLFLLTLVLLAVGATVASASTINLAWGVCRTGLTAAENDFNWPNAPCANTLNAGQVATIVPSFKNTATATLLKTVTTQIQVYTGNGSPLADFWLLDANDPLQCHGGGWGGLGVVPTSGLPANCATPYGGTASQQNFEGFDQTNAATGRFGWGNDHLRAAATNVAPPVSAGGYLSQVITLTWDDAAFDGNTCAGCDVPACIGLQKVVLINGSAIQIETISTPEIRNYVTYAGGATTPAGTCPGAVPTKSSTWGQVKALYR